MLILEFKLLRAFQIHIYLTSPEFLQNIDV